MQLTKLLSGVSYKLEQGSLNEEISGVFDNSKQCVRGSVFVALNGNNFNGNNFVKEAISNGAKVIVCENNIEECDENVTVIKVEDARSVLSKIAFNFYLPAGFSFKVIGITGTNGKTTISLCLQKL